MVESTFLAEVLAVPLYWAEAEREATATTDAEAVGFGPMVVVGTLAVPLAEKGAALTAERLAPKIRANSDKRILARAWSC